MNGRTVLVALSLLVVVTVSPLAQDAQLVEKGAKLYATNKCSICHSIDGKGNKKGPLDEVGSKLTADEIREWLLQPAEMSVKSEIDTEAPHEVVREAAERRHRGAGRLHAEPEEEVDTRAPAEDS